MTDDREPPSDLARVQHFMGTVEDYEHLAMVYPLGDDLTVAVASSDEARKWRFVLHGMVLRKYFAPDQLNLSKVVGSLREVVSDHTVPAEQWDGFQASIGVVEDVAQFIYNDGTPATESEILRRELYGRYLHGDYGKWTNRTPDAHNDVALFFAIGEQASRVKNLAALVRWYESQGQISLT